MFYALLALVTLGQRNILGDQKWICQMSAVNVANAVSACYLSDPEGKHPSWSKLSSFLKDNAWCV